MDSLNFGSFDKPKTLWSECHVKYDVDTLSEILMRLEPCNLFKCILVCKEWLSVIIDPVFRTTYLNRWKDSISSQVVGILLSDHRCKRRNRGVKLLATSNVARIINEKNLLLDKVGIGFYLSKSPKGGLLLFGVVELKRFYVCKLISLSQPVKLPPPPVYYETCMANILCSSDHGADYKVILCRQQWMGHEVSIQTFCSRMWKWEQFTFTFSTSLLLLPLPFSREGGGLVSSRGVIYWGGLKDGSVRCLAELDMNEGRISLIPNPPLRAANCPTNFGTTYALSPKGSLLAATVFGNDWEYSINMWSLDDAKQVWSSVYSVRMALIWTNNATLLASLFEARPEFGFMVLSFVPGRPGSIFLALELQLFVYHFPTSILEHVDCLKYGGFDFNTSPCFSASPHSFTYHPLTLLEIWPSSPLQREEVMPRGGSRLLLEPGVT